MVLVLPMASDLLKTGRELQKTGSDTFGLVVPEGGELQIEINPDAEYEACFFPETGRISMKPAWANDPNVGLREYARYTLFTTAKNPPRRVQQAGPQGTALESGLADYLPRIFMGDPVPPEEVIVCGKPKSIR